MNKGTSLGGLDPVGDNDDVLLNLNFTYFN